MPGNEVEDGIHKLDNYCQGQHLSQTVASGWRVLNYNQWVGKQRQIGSPQNLDLNLKNYSVQQLDSVRGHGAESLSLPLNQNLTQLIPRSEYSRNLSGNHQLNVNGFLLANQHFQETQNQPGFLDQNTGYNQRNLTSRSFFVLESQQENDPRDSPTLTTNSERSDITEASTDFSFIKGQQQKFSGQESGVSQPCPMQQSDYNDMQLLQQHLMLKKLQDLQRQQQLQQFGDVRQQNSLNQLSATTKQAAGSQFSPLINGTPVHDTSQMYMNWVQRGGSPTAQGVSNRVMLSQEQGQALRSMGLVPQQLDASLYGTPVASARGNMSQSSHLQGIAQDSVNLLTKTSGQAQKSVMQSSGFSNPFIKDQYTVSQDQVCMPQGAFMPNQGFQGKNIFGPGSVQGLNTEIVSRNLPVGNTPQMNVSAKDLNGRQEGAGWSEMQQKATQLGPSQGLVPLDPMEEKILYNMDDTIWGASFGRRPDMGSGGFGNTLENADLSNAFPSVQSGSWSALMQSAVAEASSSDTGLHEEWSGLTFQNTEPSTDNQVSNFIESDKQQAAWVDNNLPSASSFSSKPLPMFIDSSMGSSLPSFQQPGNQVSAEQIEGLYQDGTHESIESSPKVTGEWVDRNSQQKPSIEGSQQVQSYMHLDNACAGQMYEHSTGIIQQVQSGKGNTPFNRENTQFSNSAALPKLSAIEARQATSQQVPDNNQSIDKKGFESIGNNGPHVLGSSCDGKAETHEKQHNCYQMETSSDSHNSKEFSGHEQGSSSHFKIFGDVSRSAVNLDKGHLPDFQGNSKVLEKVPSRGDLRSFGSSGVNVPAQTSQNMLELLHKVDQSKEDGTVAHLGLSEVPNVVGQMYNRSSASQGFGLRLAPPSQWLPNSNHFLSQGSPETLPNSNCFLSQGSSETLSYLNSKQVNSELGEKNQNWIASQSSVQSLPPSHEMSQGAHWDNKSGTSGQVGISSPFSMHGSSVAAFTSGPPFIKNKPQMQVLPNGPQASQSSLATLPSTTSRYTPFNLANAMPASQPSGMSGMSQLGDCLTRPHNVWTNVPSWRHPSGLQPLKVPSSSSSSVDPSDNGIINPTKVQQISSGVFDASQTAGFSQGKEPPSKQISDANAPPSGSFLAHSHQRDPDGIRPGDNHAPAASARNFASISHSLKSPHNLHQNYFRLHQMHAINNAETDSSRNDLRTDDILDVQQVASSMGQKLYEHNTSLRNPMDSGLNSPTWLNSFPSEDTKILSFMTETREGQNVKASSQPALQDMPSRTMVAFGQSDSQSQSSRSNMVSSHTEHGQVNLHAAPSFFKQCGTFKNGQMLPMCHAGLAKVVAAQFSIGKSSQNLHMNTYVEQLALADSTQGASVKPSKAGTFVASEQFSAPYPLPSDITNQSMTIMRPKKRKTITSEQLAWHKEVSQGSEKLQNISMAEQEWAHATNRLFEKVENEVQMIKDMQPMLRSKKRRLIFTTQLMLQLLRPAPAFVLLANATSHCDSVSYFVSRVALGDACSLTYYARNDLLSPLEKSNVISEKLKTVEGTGYQQYSSVVEDFTESAKKLESEFQRLDKAASILDIRVEFQELERFAVINRFAMFHSRGQVDTCGNSSSSGIPKPVPQRYVTALQMPRNLPEGVQCLSL